MKKLLKILALYILFLASLPLLGQEEPSTIFGGWQIEIFTRFQNVEPKFTIFDQVDTFPARTSIVSQIGIGRELTVNTSDGDTLLFLSNGKDLIAAAQDINFTELTTTVHRRFRSGLSLFAGLTYGRYSSGSKQRLTPNELEDLGHAYEIVINKQEYLGFIGGVDYYVNRTSKWQPFIGIAADWYIRRIRNESLVFAIPERNYFQDEAITLERQLKSTFYDGSAMIRLGLLYEITPRWAATVMWRSDQLSQRHKGLLPGISIRYGWKS